MSERGDFFASGAKESKPPPTRADFFSGDFDIDADTPAPPKKEPAKKSSFSQPYSYFDPTARREAKIEQPAVPLQEIPSGFNQGVAYLMGMPVDALVNASNLTSAGLGFAQSKITGEAPSAAFDPVDPSRIPLSGAWNEQLLNSSPLGDVTSVRDPENPEARIIHAMAAGAPGGFVGGGPAAPNMAASLAGAGAGAVASELGLDPASQATLSLLAGHGAGRSGGQPPVPMRAPAEEPAAAPKSAAQSALDKAASSQSMGAAGAAVDLQKLSPDLRAAVEKAVQQTGGAVNPDVLARQIQADSLPVPVRMTPGQALGDAREISKERNARAKLPGVAEGFEAQNKALVENTRAFRDEAGPDVFSTNAVEHADTLINRYKAIDEARNADIASKYEALRDAAGGQFPVDTQALLTNVRGALKKDLATNSAPSDVMSFLEEKAAAGTMSLEDFETLRTSLARIQRSSSDGQQRHAAGVIRRQIEEMPLQEGAAELKGLADTARTAARERFAALDADPAYKAAVNETTPPDKFVQKFLISGNRDDVALLSRAMSGDESAMQTVRVATLDHLRQAAGIDGGYNGKFGQAGFNKALRGLDPKLEALLGPKLSEQTRTLGDVARYTQFQPEGSFVNNSNTFVAAAAERAGDVLEGVANVKAGGLPVGSWVRQNITDRQGRKAAEKMFEPGAGLTKLSDLTKLGKNK